MAVGSIHDYQTDKLTDALDSRDSRDSLTDSPVDGCAPMRECDLVDTLDEVAERVP